MSFEMVAHHSTPGSKMSCYNAQINNNSSIISLYVCHLMYSCFSYLVLLLRGNRDKELMTDEASAGKQMNMLFTANLQ